jgi:predicted CXXCH cytochrome family protein
MLRHLLPVLALLAVAAPAWAADGDAACLECHGDPAMTADLPGGGSVPLFVDGKQFQASVHAQQGMSCTDCHAGMTPDHATGELAAPTRHALSKKNSEVCASCHDQVVETFAKSVHGSAPGNPDLPVCSECHDVHRTVDTAAARLALQTPRICGTCHTDEQRMKKYGISTNVVDTYLADFHGMVTTFQREGAADERTRLAATCTDCHGVHDIRKTDDPGSRVIAANLLQTCQRCHEGAPPMFPQAWLSHWEPSPKRAPAVWAVLQFYRFMIPFMMGGLLLQIGLHVWRSARKKKP